MDVSVRKAVSFDSLKPMTSHWFVNSWNHNFLVIQFSLQRLPTVYQATYKWTLKMCRIASESMIIHFMFIQFFFRPKPLVTYITNIKGSGAAAPDPIDHCSLLHHLCWLEANVSVYVSYNLLCFENVHCIPYMDIWSIWAVHLPNLNQIEQWVDGSWRAELGRLLYKNFRYSVDTKMKASYLVWVSSHVPCPCVFDILSQLQTFHHNNGSL